MTCVGDLRSNYSRYVSGVNSPKNSEFRGHFKSPTVTPSHSDLAISLPSLLQPLAMAVTRGLGDPDPISTKIFTKFFKNVVNMRSGPP